MTSKTKMQIFTGGSDRTLEELMGDIRAASQRLRKAKEETSLANRLECAAINDLNRLQKEFDEKFAIFKRNCGGDWSERQRRE